MQGDNDAYFCVIRLLYDSVVDELLRYWKFAIAIFLGASLTFPDEMG
jgi:hypothetical protein